MNTSNQSSSKRQYFIYDLEVYPNLFLISYAYPETGETGVWYRIGEDAEVVWQDILNELNIRGRMLVGFNNHLYDDIILKNIAARGKTTVSKINGLNQFIFNLKREKGFGLMFPREVEEAVFNKMALPGKKWDFFNILDPIIDASVDLMTLFGRADDADRSTGAGGMGLKIIAARMGADWIKDLPYLPDEPLGDKSKIAEVIEYGKNDIKVTLDLFHELSAGIDAREAMAEKYGVERKRLLVKKDAQMAEEILIDSYCKITGTDRATIKTKKEKENSPSAHKHIRYLSASPADPQREFEDDGKGVVDEERIRQMMKPGGVVEALLNEMVGKRITRVDASDKDAESKKEGYRHDAGIPEEITINKKTYAFKLGGLHSIDEAGITRAGEGEHIIDLDAGSYYPNLILGLGFYPSHLGPEILDVYNRIMVDRLEAKKLRKVDPVAAKIEKGAKIALNSTFGKFKEKYSLLYDPRMTYGVTINGQIYLLILIERMEDAGIEVISANTDGITIRCKSEDRQKALDIAEQWRQEVTKDRPRMVMALDVVEYSVIIRRDVNSYVAIGLDGKIEKFKGSFCPVDLTHNPKFPIVQKAVIEYIVNGTPYIETIKNSDSVHDFLIIHKASRGHALDDGRGVVSDYQSTARWYLKRDSQVSIFHKKTDGGLVQTPFGQGIGLLEQLSAFDRATVDEERYVQLCEEFYIHVSIGAEKHKALLKEEKARQKALENEEKARKKAQRDAEKKTGGKKGRKAKNDNNVLTLPLDKTPDIAGNDKLDEILRVVKQQNETISALQERIISLEEKLARKTEPLKASGMNVEIKSANDAAPAPEASYHFGKKAGDYAKGITDNVVIKALLENDIAFNEKSRKEIEVDLNGDGSYEYKVNIETLKWFKTASDGTGELKGLNFLGHLSRLRPEIVVPIVTLEDANLALKAHEDEQASRIRLARKIWNEALEWNKRGMTDAQKKWKNIVARYLKNRGFETICNNLANVIRISTPRADELKKGVAVVMLNPMFGYAGPYAGKLTGVQRTYINEHGVKLDRKMLGLSGVAFVGDEHSDTILIGEGFETTASGMVALNRSSAIVCYNANTMFSFAKSCYERSRGHNDELSGNVWVLADNDFKSKTGQRAAADAVRWLREMGLAAKFVLPDATSIENAGEKGIDWNDVLKVHGVQKTLHLLRFASMNSDDVMKLEVPDASEKVRALMPVREAVEKKEVATTGNVHEARDQLDKILRKAVVDFINTGKIVPKLIKVTTGTGKSSMIRQYMKFVQDSNNSALLITTENYEQADEYANVCGILYNGRTPDEQSPGYCPAYDEMMKVLEKNHIPMQTYCQRCPSGLKYQTECAADMNTRERAKEKLVNMGFVGDKYEKLKICRWLGHRREVEQTQVAITVDSAVSDATKLYKSSPDAKAVKRLHIVDERTRKTKIVTIKNSDINLWIENIDKSVAYLERLDDTTDKLYAVRDKIIASNRATRDALMQIASFVASMIDKPRGRVTMNNDIIKAIEVAVDMSKRLVDAGKDGRDPGALKYRNAPLDRKMVMTAPWEEVSIKNGTVLSAPLRALAAIATTLKITGDIYIEKGEFIAYEITPVTQSIIDGDPVIVLDATADKAIEAMFKNYEIIDLRVKQNIKVIRHPDRYFGVGQFGENVNAERRKRALEQIKRVIDHHLNLGHAVLTHKCVVEKLELVDDENVGWFGRHHRAHDEWAGKSLAIIGNSVPNPKDWAVLYESDRIAALAGGADPDLWPAWDGEMESGVWINEGYCEIQSRIDLPRNIFIREWFLDFITNETVQAIGRVRGVNHEGEPLEVHIYGGVPLHGIWKHGIEATEYVSDVDVVGKNKAQSIGEYQDLRKKALISAANEMIVKQELISRDEISKLMKEKTGHGVGPQTYQAFYNLVAPELAELFKQSPDSAAVKALKNIVNFEDVEDAKRFLDSLRRLAKRGGGDLILGAKKVKDSQFKHKLHHMEILEKFTRGIERRAQQLDEAVARWILAGCNEPQPRE